jgi:hypothetical protein
MTGRRQRERKNVEGNEGKEERKYEHKIRQEGRKAR